jgi:branched-chain amino acid transport system substrate-binding protein
MNWLSRTRPLVIVAAALLGAFACGGGGGGGGGGGQNKGTIAIGVDLPESGSEASNGVPTLNGVKFAVAQQKSIKGFNLTVVNFDDAVNGVHDPQKGAQNINQMLANADVLAMVGPFNSNVARAEIPITNQAGLVMVSPANTNECLTRDYDYCDPKASALRPSGKPNNYFRVAATDDHQGPAMADFAIETLKLQSLAIGSDNETYGLGIANNFSKEYLKKGGKEPVSQQNYPNMKNQSDFRPFLQSAQSKAVQGIYFGGTDSNKVCVVRSQMAGIFPASTPFMGGDGVVTEQCLNDAASNAADMYGTVAAVDASHTPEAKSTIDAFKKANPNPTDYGAYTVPAYSASQAIFQAISTAIDSNGGNKPTREQVRAAMGKVKNVKTPIGTISFDKYGDIIPQVITVYHAKAPSGSEASDAPACNQSKSVCWIFEKSVNYSGSGT